MNSGAELAGLLQPVESLAFELRENQVLHFRFDTRQIQPTRFAGRPALKTNILSRQPFGEVEPGNREKSASGEPVPAWFLEELLEVTRALQTAVALRAGDILVLDNSRVMHGRYPFTDPRRRLSTRINWLDEPGG